jgi:hypothetical protein
VHPRVIDTPARCASGVTASSTLASSGEIATGPNLASSGRTNFRNPWMRSSSRRISCAMISMCCDPDFPAVSFCFNSSR